MNSNNNDLNTTKNGGGSSQLNSAGFKKSIELYS